MVQPAGQRSRVDRIVVNLSIQPRSFEGNNLAGNGFAANGLLLP
jgi:hypothetical protein